MRHDRGQVIVSTPGCGVLSQGAEARLFASRRWRGKSAAAFGALLMIGVVSFAAGCSSDDSTTGSPTSTGGAGGSGGTGGSAGAGGAGGGGDPDSSTSCALRTDVDTYTANMTKKGKRGSLSFLLLQSDPGPPAKGNNAWKLKITGADGAPITKLLTVDVFMPEHGHNSPISPQVTFDATSGTFLIDPVYLSMGGKWRVTFSVKDPNDEMLPLDSAEFFFCVN